MDLNIWIVCAIVVICTVASIAATVGDSKVISTALEGMARQPEAQGQLFTSMLIGVGLLESIPIIAVVIAFILLGKLQ